MIIHLNENRFNKFFLLTESKNSSKAKNQTLAILSQALGAEPDSEEVVTAEQEFRKKIFDDLHLTNKEYDRVIKYEPLFIKCALDVGHQINTSFLKKYTDYIIFKTKDSPNPSEIMSRYMSASSFMDLYRLVTAEMKIDNEASAEVEDNVQYTLNQNYDILGPLTHDEAKVYGNKSGNNGSGKICYTQDKGTWNHSNYSNDNENNCFLLLRKDWKTVPCKHDGSEANNGLDELSEYNGYDDYGLSMIFVFIEPSGDLHECNTRWNHVAKYGPGRGVDHALTEQDIEKLMGAPFEKVFGVKKGGYYAEINERIANGEPINGLVKICGITSNYNYKKISLNLGDIGKKYNFMKEDGTVVWDRPVELWFDYIDDFKNGFACVKIGQKYNFIRPYGEFLWDYPLEKWFDGAFGFDNGIARVCINGKWNFIKRDGTFLWDYPLEKWFDKVGNFDKNGLARVCINGKWNFLKTDGTVVWNYPIEKWFDKVGNFDKNGLARVCFNDKWNCIREDGTFLWDYPLEKWFDYIDSFFHNGVACVCFNNKWNCIREDGTLVWNHPVEEWFDNIDYFFTDLADVQFKGNWYKLSKDGKLYDGDGNVVSESKNSKKSIITESKNSSKESGIIYL